MKHLKPITVTLDLLKPTQFIEIDGKRYLISLERV